jgi:hypothetical protein
VTNLHLPTVHLRFGMVDFNESQKLTHDAKNGLEMTAVALMIIVGAQSNYLVMAMTAALLALYALALGLPSLPATEAMLTMRPAGRSFK